MNLIGSRATSKSDSISSTVQTASKVIGIVSSSQYWSKYLKDLSIKKGPPACSDRWYSNGEMLTALMDLKDVLLRDIAPNLEAQKADFVSKIDWKAAGEILEVVCPLSTCIGEIEKKDCSLGE